MCECGGVHGCGGLISLGVLQEPPGLLPFFYLLVFGDPVMFCSPGQPGIFKALPASASRVLGLQACVPTPELSCFLFETGSLGYPGIRGLRLPILTLQACASDAGITLMMTLAF